MTTGKVLHYRIIRDDPPGWNKKWYLVMGSGIGYNSLVEVRKSYPGFRLKRVKVSPLYG